MQPCSREMQSGSGGGGVGMNSLLNHPTGSSSSSQISLQDLQHNPHQIQANHHHFDGSSSSSHDDFLEQMLSTLGAPPSWPDLSAAAAAAKAPWDSLPLKPQDDDAAAFPNYDDSINLATKFRNHQISSSGAGAATKSATFTAAMMLQHQLMMARGGAGGSSMPLSLNGEFDRSHQNDIVDGSPFKSPGSDGPVQALYNGFGAGSLPSPNQFHHPQGGSMQAQPNYGAPSAAAAMNQTPAPSGSSGGAQPAQPRPRVRARRGQATDPHSIAERLRRERIAERMKALQELVPNANKTDKASMLDEIIDYVKFLQLQVKVLSMSRLGGAAAVAPLVADMSSEGGGDCIQTSGSKGGAHGRTSSNGNGNGNNQTGSSNDTMTVTEHQVAKLMEEDMGSAMQYLQGKGLCLMPISLATAISTATCHSRSPLINHHPNPMMGGGASNGAGGGDGPTSPSMSVLTVQSATAGNGVADGSVKDNASVSKP